MHWDKKATLLLVLLLISIALGMFGGESHAEYAFQTWHIYYALLGLIGSAVMILIAKPLFDRLLKRPEDYYTKGEETDE